MAYPYALHEWKPNNLYELGDVVRADPTISSNTLAFKCIVSGTSGTNAEEGDDYFNFKGKEPLFPFKITETLQDGTCTWEAFEPLAEELLKLAPTAVIDLFEIELTTKLNNVEDPDNLGAEITDTLRYHAGKNGITEDLKFDGKEYAAVPVEIDGFSFSAKGTLPRPTMRVANANNAITNLMLKVNSTTGEQYNPLGAKVRRIRTFAKFIDTANFSQGSLFASDADITDVLTTEDADSLIMQSFNDTADPQAKLVETWYIDRIASENQQFVEFELAPKLDLVNVQIPRRTIEEVCPWQYRGSECGYEGDKCFTVDDALIVTGTEEQKKNADVCGKRLKSCQKRFGRDNDLPFGGFYGARLQA